MLLDEIFDGAKLIKKVWARRGGELKLITKQVSAGSAPSGSQKPMFPISKPRYPEAYGGETIGGSDEEGKDARGDRPARFGGGMEQQR